MREMKDSGTAWIGSIPDHWACMRFKYVAKNVNYKAKNNNNYIGLENVESWTGRLLPSQNESFVAEGDSLYVKPRDVLFGKLRPYLAKCLIAETEGCCSSEFLVIEEQLLSAEYIRYMMLSPQFIEEVNMSTYGAKMPRASWNYISNLFVPYPPDDVQKRIVKYLERVCSLIDSAISKQESILEALEEYKSSRISEVVTKGLNPKAKMKDSLINWLGKVPEEYEVSTFKRICHVNQGLQVAQSERKYEPGPNRFEYITVKYIHSKDKDGIIEYIENPPASTICNEDDVLLARTGATGLVVTGVNGCFHNNFFKIQVNPEKVLNEYLVYFLMHKAVKNHLLLLAGTTTIPDLNHSDFYSTPFIIPPIEEQKLICGYLDGIITKIDKQITTCLALIEAYKKYKEALIFEVVTGKKEV